MPPSKARSEDVSAAFHTDEKVKAITQRLGVSHVALKKWWVREFGEEAVARRVEGVRPEDTFPAFHTDEGFKSVASRLGVSPNTLRKWWVEKFGQEAFEARGKKLHSEAGARTGRGGAGKTKSVSEVKEPCASCGVPVTLNLIQKARRTRILCEKCDGKNRGIDTYCPVCGLGFVGEKGLSSHMARPENGDRGAHTAYLRGQVEAVWVDKVEGHDFVVCRLCSHRGVRIDRHLQAVHGLSVAMYRIQHHGAEVQAQVLLDTRSEVTRRTHVEHPREGLKRTILCPSCGATREVGLSFAPSVHESRCPSCVDEALYGNKVEGRDFVTCQACGHHAVSLVSHIRSEHPELEGHYTEIFSGQRVVSEVASEKTDETKARMSTSAGRWNVGLTKETSLGVASSAEKRSPQMKEIRSLKFWRSVDLIELSSEQLEPFKIKNGKVSVGKAMAALGHAFVTIKRECLRNGLEVAHRHVQQALCMETVSRLCGDAVYEMEWSPEWAVNPHTGWPLRYDGFFPDLHLVVEFHGSQHFQWPNWTGMSEETFCEQQERDRLKENLIHADPVLRYFLVREDEPYSDLAYLRGRLIDEGVLDA